MNNQTMHWASVWGNAVSVGENRPEKYTKDITLRYPVYSHFDGQAVRITLDNYCGTEVNPFRPMSDLPTVAQLIDGMKYYISLARSYGYKVYVGTLLPIEGWRTYAPFREDMRCEFNEWIRTTDLIDGYVDFDKALRDPQRPTAMREEYDSGDHLHPSAAGYKAMAAAVLSEIIE